MICQMEKYNQLKNRTGDVCLFMNFVYNGTLLTAVMNVFIPHSLMTFSIYLSNIKFLIIQGLEKVMDSNFFI